MNKTQLVDALAERLGDRRTAVSAVDGLLETIVDTVKGGESVTLTGFGVFEARSRAARTARNPRTGESVAVPAATVPAFRPGTGFRTAVGGGGAPAPRSATPRTRATASAKPARTAAKAEPTVKPAKKKAAEADTAVNGKPVKGAKARATAAFSEAKTKPAKGKKSKKK